MPEFNTLLPFDLREMLRRESEGTDIQHFNDYEWVKENLPAPAAV